MLILDEADRMLDMGFMPAIKRILNKLPATRQTLLFSATFEDAIKKLAMEFMRNPREVQVAARNTVAETITHRAHPVDAARKRDLLIDILSERYQDQILVFGKTKHGCNRLAEQLEKSGIKAVAIHGNKSQSQRLKALRRFQVGQGARPGRHRRGRAWPRYPAAAAGDQLRSADGRRGLRAPHRPYRPRWRVRRGDFAGVAG